MSATGVRYVRRTPREVPFISLPIWDAIFEGHERRPPSGITAESGHGSVSGIRVLCGVVI